jgi:ABC-type antimicrobial peptide transport system permease subunit
MIIADGMRLAAIGLGIGLALALALSRFLVKLLYGVSPNDAVTLVSVASLLSAVALFASLLPARRAARIDPLRAIQSGNT